MDHKESPCARTVDITPKNDSNEFLTIPPPPKKKKQKRGKRKGKE
jgi:hypothetical protein